MCDGFQCKADAGGPSRQGLICEDSAAHNAATAVPNGVALGVPGDIAEAARCSAAASAHDGHAEGEKRKAGM